MFLFPCLSFISLSCVTRLYIKTGQLTVFSFNLEYYHCCRSNFHLFFLPSQSAGLRPGQAWGSRRSPTGKNGWLRQQPGRGQLISCSHWWGITRGFRYLSCCDINSCPTVEQLSLLCTFEFIVEQEIPTKVAVGNLNLLSGIFVLSLKKKKKKALFTL